MILRLSFFILIQFYTLQVFTQKLNYHIVRSAILFYPKNDEDTISIQNNIRNLEALDTNQIQKKYLKDYYSDLGRFYWFLAHGKNKILYQQKAFAAYSKTLFHKSHDHRALWFFALYYAYHDDCEKAKIFMTSYKKHSDKKKWNTECIAFAEAQCQ
ncbi:MAG: hypothetical protein IPP15_02470 [Saprospiraceae bacterium]|uniref:Uncharacterized protein n=1 Tax=Candidatus Opimibacter skivensis TaxID=2982028 RepID=A0A9D7SSF6_9BACT|nr:hypothetical protein [Candidatus Opimibacter skivensis]